MKEKDKNELVPVVSQFHKKKVFQSNHLIESPYAQEFSPLELKTFEYAKAYVKEEDYEKHFQKQRNKEYVLKAKEVAAIYGTSVSSVSHSLEETSKRLIKKGLHLRKVKEDGSVEFAMSNIIPNAEYKNGEYRFELNYKIIPYLLENKANYKAGFTEYLLHHILSLKSSYAMKIYQLLYQYKNIQAKNGYKFRKIQLEELKKQMGIEGKYSEYANFRIRILEPSVKQINNSTDMKLEYSTIKHGNKVDQIEFKFLIVETSVVPIYTLDLDDDLKVILEEINDEVSDKTKKLILEYVNSKGKIYVIASIKYAKRLSKINFEAYLVKTLKENCAEAEIIRYEAQIKKKEAEAEKLKNDMKIKKVAAEEVDKEQKHRAKIEKEFYEQSEDEQLTFEKYAAAIYKQFSLEVKLSLLSEETLKYAVFAVSNNKSYSSKSESSLNKKLSNNGGGDILNMYGEL